MTVATSSPTSPAPAAELSVTPPPVVPAPRTWLRRITGGGQIIETCPTFCEDTHLNDAHGSLDDLCHGAAPVSTLVMMHPAGQNGPGEWPILAARIQVDPYSEDPKRNTPHVSFEPSPDDVMECLDPDELADIIDSIRAHCDRLDEVHNRLVAAIDEHGARGLSGRLIHP